MNFIFKGNPVAKPRQTQSDKWNKRPVVQKYRAFCDNVVLQFNVQGWRSLEPKPNSIRITFYISPPKDKIKSVLEAESNGMLVHHQQTPDIDNLIKAVLDALYDDDRIIHTLSAEKFYRMEPGFILDVY